MRLPGAGPLPAGMGGQAIGRILLPFYAFVSQNPADPQTMSGFTSGRVSGTGACQTDSPLGSTMHASSSSLTPGNSCPITRACLQKMLTR